MTYDTINDAMTIAGNGEGTLLAGRYRVVRQLGQGGMGSVWLAEDTQLDNKPFAIKMLPAVLVSNKRAYRQLKDEALVAMKLTHPNIVTLRAFEENNDNPFLVMDYIDGQTLDDYLAEHGEYFTQRRREAEAQSGRARSPSAPQGGGFGRVEHVERVDGDGRGITGDEVVRILKPIAAALDYAHAEGVVHRDVKPANVMIRKDGHPFILDFSIAREIQETLTRVTGKLSSGTLLYMSPEQLNGDQPKPAQDVYSFAAMVYECLKGEPPFVRGQIEHQILNNPPPPLNLPTAGPSARGSGTLAASVMAGLAKKPENRPASCMAVLEGKDFSRVEHVERVESGGNGRARSPSAPQSGGPRPVAAVKAAATLKTAALAVAALVLVVAGGIMWHGHRQRQQDEARRQVRIVAEQKAEEERLAVERKVQEEAARRRADEERKAKEEAERRRKAAEEALLAAERKAKDAATEIRIEAKVQQGKVARISEGDGFKTRKDALEDVFIRAEAFYDEKARRWTEAGALYKDYIEQSKSVITLDGERQQAVSKRSAAQAAFRNAEAEGAKTYAKDSWNSAVKTWNEAVAEFRRMEFASAAVTFAKAVREFEGSMDEVREKKRAEEEKLAEEKRMAEAREAERRRREEAARQAESRERERRRAEERRKAMQSLPGKWRCQTTNEYSYGGRYIAQYEYDFRNGGDYVETLTAGLANAKFVSTRVGTWLLAGNTLTLRQSNSSTILPSGSVKKDFNLWSCDYKVLWKNDGSFELRFADSHPFEGKWGTISYDHQGNETRHIKQGGFLISEEYDIIQTAKIFRRVSN